MSTQCDCGRDSSEIAGLTARHENGDEASGGGKDGGFGVGGLGLLHVDGTLLIKVDLGQDLLVDDLLLLLLQLLLQLCNQELLLKVCSKQALEGVGSGLGGTQAQKAKGSCRGGGGDDGFCAQLCGSDHFSFAFHQSGFDQSTSKGNGQDGGVHVGQGGDVGAGVGDKAGGGGGIEAPCAGTGTKTSSLT